MQGFQKFQTSAQSRRGQRLDLKGHLRMDSTRNNVIAPPHRPVCVVLSVVRSPGLRLFIELFIRPPDKVRWGCLDCWSCAYYSSCLETLPSYIQGRAWIPTCSGGVAFDQPQICPYDHLCCSAFCVHETKFASTSECRPNGPIFLVYITEVESASDALCNKLACMRITANSSFIQDAPSMYIVITVLMCL